MSKNKLAFESKQIIEFIYLYNTKKEEKVTNSSKFLFSYKKGSFTYNQPNKEIEKCNNGPVQNDPLTIMHI